MGASRPTPLPPCLGDRIAFAKAGVKVERAVARYRPLRDLSGVKCPVGLKAAGRRRRRHGGGELAAVAPFVDCDLALRRDARPAPAAAFVDGNERWERRHFGFGRNPGSRSVGFGPGEHKSGMPDFVPPRPR